MTASPNDHKPTILIVDDVPGNIDVLAAVLRGEYKIKAATSGDKALALAHTFHPELMLLDVMMPGMDGYEVCRRLKSDPRPRDIPVIFVTALSDEGNEEEGFAAGGVDYLTKPINPAIVRARVKTHLALHLQQQQLEREVQARTKEIADTQLEIIRRLSIAAEYKDEETGLHIIRMSSFTRIMAKAMGLDDGYVEILYHAAPMHDVGKIGIPDRILLKPGKHDPQEWSIMKEHASIGARIIGEHASPLLQTAKEIALTHHEKWNGSGYPQGLKGEEIPICGRIVAIADVFDALTSERPYKKAWPVEEAVKEILGASGHHFDPEVVAQFHQSLPEILEVKHAIEAQAKPVALGH